MCDVAQHTAELLLLPRSVLYIFLEIVFFLLY